MQPDRLERKSPVTTDYAQLKTELEDNRYADALAKGDHTAAAKLLNEISTAIKVGRGVVQSPEVLESIDAEELLALGDIERQLLLVVLAPAQVNLSGPNTRAILAKIFAKSVITADNLLGIQERKGSRAEELFGAGIVISEADIAVALKETKS
jgi:hypothetical protein